jgi:hypothetical protein
VSRRPRELPPEEAQVGLAQVREVIDLIRKSEFGRSDRGRRLTAEADALARRGGIRFCPDLGVEALYRKELGRRPVLYISVLRHRNGVLWPSQTELAERIYHESLHAVVRSKRKCREEECDAFCAAEEAAAAIEQRSPACPVRRDGLTVWQWVRRAYAQHPSDPDYQPVGYTPEQLAVMAGSDDRVPSPAPPVRHEVIPLRPGP